MSLATASRLGRFASALSTEARWESGIESVCGAVRQQLEAPPDLALLFISADHLAESAAIATCAVELLETQNENLLGCTGESIVGAGKEIEGSPALSLWAARLPGVAITTMHLRFQSTPDGSSFLGWPDRLIDWPTANEKTQSLVLALADPFSFPADLWIERLSDDHPTVPVIGGMASAGQAPRMNRLVLGSRAFAEGAVAVALHGELQIRTVVSQGCRPIGQPFVITKAERNVILELGGMPTLQRLRQVFDELPNRDKQLVQQGIYVGRVVSEYRDHFEQGDFLIRNVTSIDQETGALAVAEYVRPGQTIQFHVRDQSTADDEIRQLLAKARQDIAPSGALLFTCNGRGTRLFDQPHHDALAIHSAMGDIPVAGFFAAGEIGPIGGRNFLHGFTASMVLFQ